MRKYFQIVNQRDKRMYQLDLTLMLKKDDNLEMRRQKWKSQKDKRNKKKHPSSCMNSQDKIDN